MRHIFRDKNKILFQIFIQQCLTKNKSLKLQNFSPKICTNCDLFFICNTYSIYWPFRAIWRQLHRVCKTEIGTKTETETFFTHKEDQNKRQTEKCFETSNSPQHFFLSLETFELIVLRFITANTLNHANNPRGSWRWVVLLLLSELMFHTLGDLLKNIFIIILSFV